MWTPEEIKAFISVIIVGTIAASIRALMVSNETPIQKVRTFFAGVLMSALCAFILTTTAFSALWRYLITASFSAFISTVWPILEKITTNTLKKKGKDVSDIHID